MSQEIIETIRVLGLQNYVNYKRRNANYKKFEYRFLIENLLFSSNLENDTDVIFVTCNGLIVRL